MSRVAVVIIGDEILTGKFPDQNGPHAIARLRAIGADLVRMATIRDGIDSIADEVRLCSELADAVVTSGGVGPTHDDMTLAAVAKAFSLPMVRSPALVALLESFNLPINEASLQMATVPKGTELIMEGKSRFPVMRCRNVYCLPGVPKLFVRKFEGISHRFAGPTLHTARLHTHSNETAIAAILRRVADQHPEVSIGSYPRFEAAGVYVIVTMESRDAGGLAAVEAALRDQLPHVVEAPEPDRST